MTLWFVAILGRQALSYETFNGTAEIEFCSLINLTDSFNGKIKGTPS
ncbi:hypothetical protein FG05_35267 [Fusarium graminearum]|nr:hypothetical protein FG05_35267 [Fusarium graminearum]